MGQCCRVDWPILPRLEKLKFAYVIAAVYNPVIPSTRMPTESSKTSFSVVPPSPDLDDGKDTCPICFGSGMEIVKGKGAKICSCQKQDAHTGNLRKAKLPRRYENCYITNYKPNHPSQIKGKKLAEEFGMKYPAFEGGLIYTGPVGVGKTHLAVSILKLLSERGFTCLFYEFGSLLKEIQDSYNPNTKTSELTVLSPVLNVEVLVLDELGASKPTDWVRDTMAHIINTRYNEKRATIFTTNYPDEREAERDETLEDRIGIRLRSRLYEMCKTVELKGEDYRRKKLTTS